MLVIIMSCIVFMVNYMILVLCTTSQRKQQRDLLAALQKVVVPIYCTSFLAVEEDKQQKITRVSGLPVQCRHCSI